MLQPLSLSEVPWAPAPPPAPPALGGEAIEAARPCARRDVASFSEEALRLLLAEQQARAAAPG